MLAKITHKLHLVAQAPRIIKRCYAQQKKLLGRYKATPIDLFRIQNSTNTKLKDFNAPQAKNILAYDVKTGSDGLIHPKTSEFFEGPSGARLMPLYPEIFWTLADYDEFEENPRIYRIPKGTQLPDNLIILHERPEYYSLQTTEPVKLSVLNKRCTEFFNQFKPMDANEFQTKYNYVEIQKCRQNHPGVLFVSTINVTVTFKKKMLPITKITCRLFQVAQGPRSSKRLYSQQQKKLLGRFKTTPVELFRIQNGADTKLREFSEQQKRNSKSYDLTAGPDGLIHPKTSEFFEGPNGASLKPLSPHYFEIISHWEGKDARIYRIPKGTKVPDNLIILHERPEHYSLLGTQLPDNLIILHERPEYYSLQTTEPVKLSELNKRCSAFFNQFEHMDPNEFQTKYNYVDVVNNDVDPQK